MKFTYTASCNLHIQMRAACICKILYFAALGMCELCIITTAGESFSLFTASDISVYYPAPAEVTILTLHLVLASLTFAMYGLPLCYFRCLILLDPDL